MTKFVDESNKLFRSLNNMKVIVPSEYEGVEPTLKLDKDNSGITLDMGEALVFTLNNVEWELDGPVNYTDNIVWVENGKLKIYVQAEEL